MVLRSDEKVNESEAERDKNFRGNVKKGIGIAASVGAAAVGGPLAARVLPFLSEYIPAALAMKGINKISPKLGSFLQKGQEMGLDIKDGLDFIKEKMEPKKPSKEGRNIIEQYAPHLHRYIYDMIKKGNTPVQAAIKAKKFLDKKDLDIIKQIEKDHKTDFSDIVTSIFGQGLENQTQDQSNGQPQEQLNANNPQQAQQGQTQQQGGQGQQALMAILQQIQQTRGKK
jgi:hypothetical protein